MLCAAGRQPAFRERAHRLNNVIQHRVVEGEHRAVERFQRVRNRMRAAAIGEQRHSDDRRGECASDP
jgi:hypothetical protein